MTPWAFEGQNDLIPSEKNLGLNPVNYRPCANRLDFSFIWRSSLQLK